MPHGRQALFHRSAKDQQRQPQHSYDGYRLYGFPPRAGKPWASQGRNDGGWIQWLLVLDKDGKPKVAMHLENYMRGMRRKYVKKHGNTLPSVTPHVLRHTFCTNAQQAMLDVKSLQYLMGHSTASVTLDVYTHSDFESAERAFRQIAEAL